MQASCIVVVSARAFGAAGRSGTMQRWKVAAGAAAAGLLWGLAGPGADRCWADGAAPGEGAGVSAQPQSDAELRQELADLKQRLEKVEKRQKKKDGAGSGAA